MMSQSKAAWASSPRLVAALGVVTWTVLLWACSGTAADPATRGGFVRGDGGGSDPVANEAGDDAAAGDVGPNGPTYMGKAVADNESDASGSVASADGYCPIPDSLLSYGAMCPSCAQTHCASALSECDPTMVNSCTEYYCPTQCLRPDAQGAGACTKVVQCCPTLFGTALGLTCGAYTASSAQSACQSLLSQAQALGRCE
jgi:hypothetical protein